MNDRCDIRIISAVDREAKREADRTGWWAHAFNGRYFVMGRIAPEGTTYGSPD